MPHGGPQTSGWCGVKAWVGHQADGETAHVWQCENDCEERHCGACRSRPKVRCSRCECSPEDGPYEMCTGGDEPHDFVVVGHELRGWERRGARRIDARWKKLLAGPLAGRTVFHVVLSPPQDEALAAIQTVEGYRRLRDEMRARAKDLGVGVACAIFHHVRIEGERWLPEDVEDPRGVRPGPHWHLLAVADDTGTAAVNGVDFDADAITRWHAETGWVAKWLGPRESVYKSAGYMLSHAGLAVPPGGPLSRLSGEVSQEPVATVTWFGLKRGSEWAAPKRGEGGENTVRCPVCERELAPEDVCAVSWPRMRVPPEPPPGGRGYTVLLCDVELRPRLERAQKRAMQEGRYVVGGRDWFERRPEAEPE